MNEIKKNNHQIKKSLINEIQERDSSKLINILNNFWEQWSSNRCKGAVTPPGILTSKEEILVNDPYPSNPNSLESVIEEFYTKILPKSVKTSHPLFLGYVTPPTLDISWLGNAIIAILNQNVSFASLSPAGTAVEMYVIDILCKLIGYSKDSGGVFVSGGSAANLHALLMARRFVLGEKIAAKGNYSSNKHQRIYCSEQIHRSIHKAAIVMGIGIDNLVEIPCDENHHIKIDKLKEIIRKDKSERKLPIAIIGAAGTRAFGSFDDLKSLARIADDENLWFHIDGAYGAFLKLAENHPSPLDYLHLAHSVTLDPHKLLFMPFDSGCILVKDKQKLLDTFGAEGEYLEKSHVIGSDFCDYGIQLGRSMKAFNVWLALKYFGINTFKKEYERLLQLAQDFRLLIQSEKDFDLIGPSESIIVCFRWNPQLPIIKKTDINHLNETIRKILINDGIAFINGVKLKDTYALRVCLTNYSTKIQDLQYLMEKIKTIASGIL